MWQQIRFALASFLTVGLIVYGASYLPPLTEGGNTMLQGVSRDRYVAAYGRERAYCENNLQDMNCQCFASISGMIQTDGRHRAPGSVNLRKEDLARWQAEDKC